MPDSLESDLSAAVEDTHVELTQEVAEMLQKIGEMQMVMQQQALVQRMFGSMMGLQGGAALLF